MCVVDNVRPHSHSHSHRDRDFVAAWAIEFECCDNVSNRCLGAELPYQRKDGENQSFCPSNGTFVFVLEIAA